jgi:alanine racemase
VISPIRAEVSAAALRHNLACLRQTAPASRIMAVVKANAYGHGLVHTARCLTDADAFGVARLPEALMLRSHGVQQPVVLLEGVFETSHLAEAAAASRAAPLTVWLKIDTGMNRLGFRPEQVPAVLRRIQALGDRIRGKRLMTHFASADEAENPQTAAQIGLFEQLTAGLGWPRSLCNSAGVFAQPQAQGDWVRPGLATYGVSPFAELLGTQLGLKPAMRLVSTVIAVRHVLAGEGVGYGGIWRAPRDTRVAIIAAGYGDGLPRLLPFGTPVLLAGHRAGLVGRVSMDMIAVDVGQLPQVAVGETAVLWGPELPVEEIAAHAGTIPYELLCGVSQRVPLTLV